MTEMEKWARAQLKSIGDKPDFAIVLGGADYAVAPGTVKFFGTRFSFESLQMRMTPAGPVAQRVKVGSQLAKVSAVIEGLTEPAEQAGSGLIVGPN